MAGSADVSSATTCEGFRLLRWKNMREKFGLCDTSEDDEGLRRCITSASPSSSSRTLESTRWRVLGMVPDVAKYGSSPDDAVSPPSRSSRDVVGLKA